MKRVLTVLLLILLLPLNVKAEENLKITNVELIDKKESVEVLEKPIFTLTKVDFNLKFSEVGGYAKYKITINNNSTEDYEISNETKFSEDNYIKYEFTYENGNIVKSKSQKAMFVTLTYNKEVPKEKYENGKYKANNKMKLELVNNNIVVNVPKTYKGYTKAMLILGIAALVVSASLLIIIKNKKVKTLIIISLIIIPISVKALQKIVIEINTQIEIEGKFTGIIYRHNETHARLKDSIVSESEHKWVETDGNISQGAFDTEESCQADIDANGYASSGVYCEQKAITVGGAGEYKLNAKELNKQENLKHNIVEDTITESYVCFIKDNKEYCLRGGNGSYYNENKTILLNVFGSENCETNSPKYNGEQTNYASNKAHQNNLIKLNKAKNIGQLKKLAFVPSTGFTKTTCSAFGFEAYAEPVGSVKVTYGNSQCTVTDIGDSYCVSTFPNLKDGDYGPIV